MNIVKLKIYLVAQMELNWADLDSFLANNGVSPENRLRIIGSGEQPSDLIPEIAGRLCYMSYNNPRPGGNFGYLQHIKEVGHGSVLEHAEFSFIIEGVSRSFTHELVRHRAGTAFSQLSQRYVNESTAEYVCPEIIKNDPELYPIWLQAIEVVHLAYVNLADRLNARLSDPASQAAAMLPENATKTDIRKAARQAARSVLPNATETKIYMTGNARAWRHFIEMRADPAADVEIREVAGMIFDKLKEAAPNLFDDYVDNPLSDGTRHIETEYRKV